MNLNNERPLSRPCAICETITPGKVIYEEQLAGEALDAQAFSARRFYNKKIHFQLIRCNNCGLVRSDPIVDDRVILDFYRESKFTYEEELPNLRRTYGRYLAELDDFLKTKENFLEIGCGNGFFLEEALAQGFKNVYGVEPSTDAVNKAPDALRRNIKVDIFRPGLFFNNLFDVICIFQTLDHLLEPGAVLKECFKLLKPGGLVLAINHNVRSWSAHLLGEASPIIDIEHTYLYDPETMSKLFQKNNFRVLKTFLLKNRYSVNYFFSLLPLKPLWLKTSLNKFLRGTGLANPVFSVPIGNLGLIAKK